MAHVPAEPARQPPKRSRWRRLGLGVTAALLSTIVTLAAGEVLIRLLAPAAVFAVLADVHASDPDPGIGYTLKRNYRGEAYGVPLRTNQRGFRGPDWPTAKADGTLRVALIGDSHAFGYGVSFEHTLGEQLAARLRARLQRPVEVLNFGVTGYNTAQELAVLEQRALPLEPDLVLVLACNNDADAALWVDRRGLLRSGTPDDQAGLDNLNADWRQRGVLRFEQQIFGRSRLLLWLRLQWYRWSMRRGADACEVARGAPERGAWLAPVGPGPIDDALRAPVLQPLAAMASACRARGIPLVLLTFTALDNWRTTFAAFAHQQSVPMLELLPLLAADSWVALLQRWSLGWDPHMGSEAQAVWAAGVEQFLVEQRLVR